MHQSEHQRTTDLVDRLSHLLSSPYAQWFVGLHSQLKWVLSSMGSTVNSTIRIDWKARRRRPTTAKQKPGRMVSCPLYLRLSVIILVCLDWGCVGLGRSLDNLCMCSLDRSPFWVSNVASFVFGGSVSKEPIVIFFQLVCGLKCTWWQSFRTSLFDKRTKNRGQTCNICLRDLVV